MFNRIVLFVITNLAVIFLLNIVLTVFGIGGGSATGLVIMATLFGMGGSLISLFMSKWIAKRSTGAQVIEQPSNAAEQWLVATVRAQAQKAGIGMPEVAIFPSPAPNAFATGASRNGALVAVSTGLLDHMDQDEVEAVLAHEVAHIANGDMVTLTLIQGVLNTFVILLARLVASVVSQAMASNSDEEGAGGGNWMAYFAVSMVAEIIFGLFATMIVMAFSRWREFRADAGGAMYASRAKMIAALRRLQAAHEPSHLPSEMAAFGIIGGAGGLLQQLFASHPPLEKRIEALVQGGGDDTGGDSGGGKRQTTVDPTVPGIGLWSQVGNKR